MIKIQYQRKSGQILIPVNEFENIRSHLKSNNIEFEEIETMTKEEELAYDEAMNELANGESVKYEKLLKMRAKKNV